MDDDGLAQADDRLSRMQQAYNNLVSNADLATKESAWVDFLVFHGTFYSKIEQASKSPDRSRKWFEVKRLERKSDGLLRYLHHARNAGEHTIQRIASKAQFAVTAMAGDVEGSFGISFDANGKPYAVGDGVKNMKVHQNEIMIQAAKDRGVSYPPPREHGGKQIDGITAREVAELAVNHAIALIEEARNLG